MNELSALQSEARGLSALELITWARGRFGPGGVVFASSMGAEDQVITHMISANAPDVPVFTLDTGRLFQQTHDLIEESRRRYGMPLGIYFPDYNRVEEMVRERGPNLFYESVENRKLCCHIRKVEPLERALAGRQAWITGLRQAQSVTRERLNPVEWDQANSLVKLAPLSSWTEDDVWDYIRENDVPYNKLHDQGYPSIGCAPCTRAVKPGEGTRSGRWWWENPAHKECGLHTDDRQQPPRFSFDPVSRG